MIKSASVTPKQAAKKIARYLVKNGLFGTIFISNVEEDCPLDISKSPYHAGVLQVQSSIAFQSDYKSMGEPIYQQFRDGMYDAAKGLGLEIAKAELKEADQ